MEAACHPIYHPARSQIFVLCSFDISAVHSPWLNCSMAWTPSEDERTTEVGLYHFARSYRAAADYLDPGPSRVLSTHPNAPRDFLYIHAIELYLKSFLRLHGKTVQNLKNEGHDIPRLAGLMLKHGVIISHDVDRVLSLLTRSNVFGARYIVTGAYRRAATAGLQMAALELHEIVRSALRDRGRLCAD